MTRFLVMFILAGILVTTSSARDFGPSSVNQSFQQQSASRFTQPEGDILSVAVIPDGRAIVAAISGLFISSADRLGPWEEGPGFEITVLEHDGETLWAGGGHQLAKRDQGGWDNFNLAEEIRIDDIRFFGDKIGIGTNQGFCFLDKETLDGIIIGDQPIRAFTVLGDWIYLGTDDHLLRATTKGGSLEELIISDDKYSWSPTQVTALASDGSHLWMGCKEGAAVFDGTQWKIFTGEEGLPYDHFTCAEARDGKVWFGTEWGAVYFNGDEWSYRAGDRWLPDDHVNDLSIAPDGTVWIATPGGVSKIQTEDKTLAEKAKEYEEIIDQRHWRMDYVVRCKFHEKGNLDTHWINHTDNDGLYSAMYGASQAFRHAATKDPEAKERAKRIFKGLLFLEQVTPMSGFPARSVIPADWEPNPNTQLTPEVNRKMKEEDPLWKEIFPRWPTSEDGKYLWKCDTSSDEICGHYFFYALYYDFVAETDEEKAEVRDLVRRMTDHIVDHGYRLIDYDGEPTRWANWSPEYVNGPDGWADRGIQSVEILSFLNV
ncbi:MAG: hypothetical protein KC994_16935, partial [Candidatus Omnitrophica bacterium]|nr:hypothetical protein [Candidatus Omnitrophota bacterium]